MQIGEAMNLPSILQPLSVMGHVAQCILALRSIPPPICKKRIAFYKRIPIIVRFALGIVAIRTRRVIHKKQHLKNDLTKLLDTAGISETSDIVEQIGVERSKTALAEADLILLVLNSNDELQLDEIALMKQLADKQTIVILNKIDLDRKLDVEQVLSYFPQERIVELSLIENKGIEDLEKAIAAIFFEGKLESSDLTYVSNVRHISLLKQAKRSLQDALDANEQYVPIDMIQIDIRAAWEQLGEIIGDSVGESLIDQIFTQFCLGK